MHEFAASPVLVTRKSAQAIGPLLRGALRQSATAVLDFEGIEGTTPSFIDEMLRLIRVALGDSTRTTADVLVKNFPAPGVSRLPILAELHGLMVSQSSPSTFRLELGPESPRRSEERSR